MCAFEKRLARLWHEEDGIAAEEIGRRLRRDKSSIWRNLDVDDEGRDERPGVGRKAALTEQDKDRLVSHAERLVEQANVRWLVTADMIRETFQPTVCKKVLLDALHERDVWFCKLREKPILTDDDIAARWDWARKYRNKSPAWFRTAIQLHIDNHHFKVPAHGQARRDLAAKRVHGSFRLKKKSLEQHHVKQSPKSRINTGARGVLITGGLGAGKALLWHVVDRQWCAEVAAEMYEGPLLSCLKKQYPNKRSWSVLEDNDPSGYLTMQARDAKVANNIEQFEIPKRSPDLNVLDYYFWSQVERKLREQEKRFPEHRKETRQEFISRLRRVVREWPQGDISRAIGDLARRAKLLYKAKGKLFDESATV